MCKRCYRTPARLCGKCDRVLPVACRATENSPDICINCYRGPIRACSVCAKRRPCNRDRVTRRPTCASCHSRPRQECGRCGRTREVQALWPLGPVCNSCYQWVRQNPGPCSVCRIPRALVGVNDGGGPACGPCSGVDIDYTCRTCGRAGYPYAQGSCDRCVLKERIKDLLAGPDGTVSEQLRGVVAALNDVPYPARTLRWLRGGRAAQMLVSIAKDGKEVTHQLLDSMPPGPGLNYLRGVLVHAGALPQRDEYLERMSPWLDGLLEDCPPHHVRLIRPFAQWHVLLRARRNSNRRSFTPDAGAATRNRISVALRFLKWLDEQNLPFEELRQGDLDDWLHFSDGRTSAYQVRYFVGWAVSRRLIDQLEIPVIPQRQPTDFLDDAEYAEQLRRCLNDVEIPINIRVVGTLVLLFGVPIKNVLSLSVDDVWSEVGGTYAKLGGKPLLLPPRLADLMAELAHSDLRSSSIGRTVSKHYLFPGLIPGHPANSTFYGKSLNRYGIQVRLARNTARLAQALDLPASVIADLFGMHINTAVRWVRYAKRDWLDYVADRAADTRSPGIPHSRNK